MLGSNSNDNSVDRSNAVLMRLLVCLDYFSNFVLITMKIRVLKSVHGKAYVVLERIIQLIKNKFEDVGVGEPRPNI